MIKSLTPTHGTEGGAHGDARSGLAIPGKRTLAEALPPAGTAGAQEASPTAAPFGDGFEVYLKRLEKPGYHYLKQFALPVIDRMRQGAERGDDRTVLAAMFGVSAGPATGPLAPVKAASDAYHAELGEQALSRLTGEVPAGSAEATRDERVRLALQLSAQYSGLLEDQVAMRLEVGAIERVGDAVQIPITAGIAPNDWWRKALILGSIGLGAGALALLWRGVIAPGSATTRDGAPAPRGPAGDQHGSGASEPEGAEAGGRTQPVIAGAENLHNDCFLHAACQMLASSYLGVLRDEIVALQAFLERFRPDAPRTAEAARALADQLAPIGASAAGIARTALERPELAELQRLVVLRRFLARINAGGGPIPASETAWLRRVLREGGIVEHATRQEDASPVVSMILDRFGQRGSRALRLTERIELQQWDTVSELQNARGAFGHRPEVEVPSGSVSEYRDHGAGPSRPELERESLEDALYVPLETGHPGLIPWLVEAYGPGIIENFSTNPLRRRHEWASVGDERSLVSVTQRKVSRKFVSLPRTLTVVLRRVKYNPLTRQEEKETRAFAMPEQLSLVEHPADGAPRSKHFRLVSFIHHQGPRATSGHYYAHRRLAQGWHAVNDTEVTRDARAQGSEPAEGELEHDINHGYLYTYQEVDAPGQDGAAAHTGHAGVPLDRDQLAAVAPPRPAIPPPPGLVDRSARGDGLLRKTRQVYGTDKVRAMAVPGLTDTVEALVPSEDQGAMYVAIDQILDEMLPRVLWAYTLDLSRPGDERAVPVPLMDIAPAMRLLEQVIAWWMHFNPTVMKQPIAEIVPLLVAYVDGVVDRMEADRAKVDIGQEEEEDGGAPGKPSGAGDAQAEVLAKNDSAGGDSVGQPAAKSSKDEATAARPSGSADHVAFDLSFFGDLGGGLAATSSAGTSDARAPALSEAEEELPAWIRDSKTAFQELRAAMIANRSKDLVVQLRTEILAKQNSTTRKIAVFLWNLAQGKTPAMPPSKYDLFAIAGELGLFDGKPDEVVAKYRPGDAPPAPTPAAPAPAPAAGPPAGKKRDVLKEAQRAGWVTRRETHAAFAAMGEHAFTRAMERNVDKGKLSKVRGLVEGLQRAPGPGSGLLPPLTRTSLIIDTNLLDALVSPREQLSPNELDSRESIEAVIREHHITDLRLANINVGESYEYGDLIGRSFHLEGTPPRDLPFFGLPLEPDAAHRRGDYHKLMLELQAGAVGETKGHEDRAMVADGFFAETTHGDVPQLATADKGIYNALMRMTEVEVDGDKQALDPTEFAAHRSREDLVKALAARTGARYFVPTVAGRQIVVHPLVKKTDPAEGTPASKKSYDRPQDAPCGPHTVGDLMRLINATGYDSVIVGGAVRDMAVGKTPKDVDIKTSMPMAMFEALVSGHPEWSKLHRTRRPEMHLVQIGTPPDLVDVSCGADDATPGRFDVASDAPTRDFRMNAMYMDVDGTVHDPLGGQSDLPLKSDEPAAAGRKPGGRLRFAADPGPATKDGQPIAAATRIAQVVSFLKKEPWCLGRTLKFIVRGYELDAEILDGIREHAVEILQTIDQGDRPVKARSLLLFKTDVESPEELVALMRRFHFSPQAIRLVLPDSIAGSVTHGEQSFDRDVMPRDRQKPDAPDALGGLPALKVDMAAGRIYQYRIEATAPALTADQKPEPLLIDIDCSNHDVAGHPAPHYHIYRWVKGPRGEAWDKNQAGLSHTGQPGLPRLDGGTYLGPQPWRWRDGLSGGDQLNADLLKIGRLSGVPVRFAGDIVELGEGDGQTRAHRQLLQRVFEQGRLDELFLVVKNFMDGVEFDADDAQIQEMVGSKDGQFRLRFGAQLRHIEAFLESCGVPAGHPLFAALDRRARLRLFDLVNADVTVDARREAAAWALTQATTIDQFVQRFEFHLAATGDGEARRSTRDVDARWTEVVAAVTASGAVTPSGVKVPDGDVITGVKAIAGQLGFDSEATAAYHVEKHMDELDPEAATDAPTVAASYLALAREGVANAERVEQSGEESGDRALVLWRDQLKVVVRVTPGNQAYLVTAFTKRNARRSKAAAPRVVLASIAPPKPTVVIDERQRELERLKKKAKAGTVFQFRGEGVERGWRYKTTVLSNAQARDVVGEPLVLTGPDDPAISERSDGFYVHGRADKKVDQITITEEDLSPVRYIACAGVDF